MKVNTVPLKFTEKLRMFRGQLLQLNFEVAWIAAKKKNEPTWRLPGRRMLNNKSYSTINFSWYDLLTEIKLRRYTPVENFSAESVVIANVPSDVAVTFLENI